MIRSNHPHSLRNCTKSSIIHKTNIIFGVRMQLTVFTIQLPGILQSKYNSLPFIAFENFRRLHKVLVNRPFYAPIGNFLTSYSFRNACRVLCQEVTGAAKQVMTLIWPTCLLNFRRQQTEEKIYINQIYRIHIFRLIEKKLR